MGAPASWVLEGKKVRVYSVFHDGPADVLVVDQAGVGVGLDLIFGYPVPGGWCCPGGPDHDQDASCPNAATQALRLAAVVVLPTPPFWFCYCDDFLPRRTSLFLRFWAAKGR